MSTYVSLPDRMRSAPDSVHGAGECLPCNCTEGLVSVIIPAHNSSEYIRDCVESVLQQTYKSLEIIVVDDGSTDHTRAVLEPYILQKKIQYIYQVNKGPGAARNTAIEKSAGEFIAFIDADDLWVPEKLEEQIALFRKDQNVGFVYADAELFGEEWERQKSTSRKLRTTENSKLKYFVRGDIYTSLLSYNFIHTPSVVVRRDILDQAGYFLETIRSQRFSFGEDFELWLRIAKLCKFDYTTRVLVRKRVHLNQLTHDKRHGYKQLCSLYHYLFFRPEATDKILIAWKYLVNSCKLVVSFSRTGSEQAC